MDVKGVFLQGIRWTMTDEVTKKVSEGTTIRLGIVPDGTEYNPTVGFRFVKYTGGVDLFAKIPHNIGGEPVKVTGRLVPGSRDQLKFLPESIERLTGKDASELRSPSVI